MTVTCVEHDDRNARSTLLQLSLQWYREATRAAMAMAYSFVHILMAMAALRQAAGSTWGHPNSKAARCNVTAAVWYQMGGCEFGAARQAAAVDQQVDSQYMPDETNDAEGCGACVNAKITANKAAELEDHQFGEGALAQPADTETYLQPGVAVEDRYCPNDPGKNIADKTEDAVDAELVSMVQRSRGRGAGPGPGAGTKKTLRTERGGPTKARTDKVGAQTASMQKRGSQPARAAQDKPRATGVLEDTFLEEAVWLQSGPDPRSCSGQHEGALGKGTGTLPGGEAPVLGAEDAGTGGITSGVQCKPLLHGMPGWECYHHQLFGCGLSSRQ